MSSPSVPASVVKSLYRSLLREASKLPYGYLRAFFRFRSRDDAASAARSVARGRNSSAAKFKRLNRDLRKLRSANEGDRHALSRVLNLAYGRSGKLRRELLEPLLRSSTIEAPPPIIPGVEKSCPPVYTKELSALLFSATSRTTDRVLRPAHLKTPPNLPARVDPSSEEARLLGPLSKRREVNLRWRFFTAESRRVHPPLQISVARIDSATGVVTPLSDSVRAQNMEEFGLINGGLQDTGLQEALESMVATEHPSNRTRRERMAAMSGESECSDRAVHTEKPTAPPLPTRTLRRIHRSLLGSLPVLTYHLKGSSSEQKPLFSGSYEVSLSKQANSASLRYTASHLPLIDEVNMAWVQHAKELDEQQRSKSEGGKQEYN